MVGDMFVEVIRPSLSMFLEDKEILTKYEVARSSAASLIIENGNGPTDLFILDGDGQILHWEELKHPLEKVASYVGYLTDIPVILSGDEGVPIWRIKTVIESDSIYLKIVKENDNLAMTH